MPVQQSKDYYAILGLMRSATTSEVKKAFRRLARVHHPDVAKNKAAGEMMFKEIHEAYEVLVDPLKRRQYDEADGNWKYGTPGRPESKPRPTWTSTAAPPKTRSRRVNFEETDPNAEPKSAYGNPWEGATYQDYKEKEARNPTEAFARPSAFDTDPKNKMPAKWFIRGRTGSKEGPFDFVELAALLRCGDITGATAVVADGESGWRPFQQRHEFGWARDMPGEIIYRHLNKKATDFAESKPFTIRKAYYFTGLLGGMSLSVLYFFIFGGGKFVLGGVLNYVMFKIFFYLVGDVRM
jgi:curved DNA-binding protein CbpA